MKTPQSRWQEWKERKMNEIGLPFPNWDGASEPTPRKSSQLNTVRQPGPPKGFENLGRDAPVVLQWTPEEKEEWQTWFMEVMDEYGSIFGMSSADAYGNLSGGDATKMQLMFKAGLTPAQAAQQLPPLN